MGLMKTGQLVRINDNGEKMELLCANNGSPISFFLDKKTFRSFAERIQERGWHLHGITIQFNEEGEVAFSAPDQKVHLDSEKS